jgi:hypothetical protein
MIIVTKHFGSDAKQLEVLMCYNFQHIITYDEEDVIFHNKIKVFSIGTIILPKEARILIESQVELDVIPQMISSIPNTNVKDIQKLVGIQHVVSLEDMVYP